MTMYQQCKLTNSCARIPTYLMQYALLNHMYCGTESYKFIFKVVFQYAIFAMSQLCNTVSSTRQNLMAHHKKSSDKILN